MEDLEILQKDLEIAEGLQERLDAIVATEYDNSSLRSIAVTLNKLDMKYNEYAIDHVLESGIPAESNVIFIEEGVVDVIKKIIAKIISTIKRLFGFKNDNGSGGNVSIDPKKIKKADEKKAEETKKAVETIVKKEEAKSDNIVKDVKVEFNFPTVSSWGTSEKGGKIQEASPEAIKGLEESTVEYEVKGKDNDASFNVLVSLKQMTKELNEADEKYFEDAFFSPTEALADISYVAQNELNNDSLEELLIENGANDNASPYLNGYGIELPHTAVFTTMYDKVIICDLTSTSTIKSINIHTLKVDHTSYQSAVYEFIGKSVPFVQMSAEPILKKLKELEESGVDKRTKDYKRYLNMSNVIMGLNKERLKIKLVMDADKAKMIKKITTDYFKLKNTEKGII